MKKNASLFILLILVMLTGNAVFAGMDFLRKNEPLTYKQEYLFTLGELGIKAPNNLLDLEYDRMNNQLYIIGKEGGENPYPTTEQYVYSLDSKMIVEEPRYLLNPEFNRLRIELIDGGAWSLERNLKTDSIFLNDLSDDQEDDLKDLVELYDVKDFVVEGNKVLFQPIGCSEHKTFMMWSIDPLAEVGESLEYVKIEDHIDDEYNYNRCAFDFSTDGEEIIFSEMWDDSDGVYINSIYWEANTEIDQKTIQKSRKFKITKSKEECECAVFDLYTTEDYIVVLSKALVDEGGQYVGKGYIERYTYDGILVDGVETNFCVKKMTQGPNGSTIYIQAKYPEEENQERKEFSALEVIQINWNGEGGLSQNNGPRPVIQERTRAGYTVARFTDHQFGLLRIEEPETGIVDYSAPIRSNEKLVKLQIPYGDIKAKMESGARNLMVDYQDQTLTFPMEFFACDEMLAAMPCQTDATIEIIMQTDEAGNVTYNVQLFVVEQVNGMTKVVHRKTIQ